MAVYNKAGAPEVVRPVQVGSREPLRFRFTGHYYWHVRTGLLSEPELQVRSCFTSQGQGREAQTGTCREFQNWKEMLKRIWALTYPQVVGIKRTKCVISFVLVDI